ncbi:MAG: hypothetical protein RL186_1219 [Pseudomonadota bacterium]|jgi:predicted nucleic acid-binding protein
MTCVGLDTNILAYAAGVRRVPDDTSKVQAARRLLESFKPNVTLFASTQTWGELFTVLTRTGMSRSEARAVITKLRTGIATASVSTDVIDSALEFAERNAFQIWDAIILMSCQSVGCTFLLSEDMQDGFKVGDLLIANPLAERTHPKLDLVRNEYNP